MKTRNSFFFLFFKLDFYYLYVKRRSLSQCMRQSWDLILSKGEKDGFILKGEWRGEMKKLALEEETAGVFQRNESCEMKLTEYFPG